MLIRNMPMDIYIYLHTRGKDRTKPSRSKTNATSKLS